MSTFLGFLDGIEGVSIDRFTQYNFKSKAFFLSHCHTDHMIGLNDVTPETPLPGPLYLSEISQIIIQRRYPNIKHMIPLQLGEITPIAIEKSKNHSSDNHESRLCVTAIPAGHCPGSIMLLFEHNNKRILYTGDFRLCREDIEPMIALKKFHEKTNLDCIYLDSTFLSADYMHFPKQRESINIITKLAEDWLAKNPKNVVVLRPPAAYGYEFLLMELSKYFGTKIHVQNSTFKDYLYIPQFDSYISNNRFHCGRIHLCSTNPVQWQLFECPCMPGLDKCHICIIRPTAMKWRNLNATDQYYEKYNEFDNIYSVCYSNHSSLNEIKFLINYLRPKMIKLNVIPKNVRQQQSMYDILSEITEENNIEINGDAMDGTEPQSESIFNFSKILSIPKKRSMSLDPDEISQLSFRKRPKNQSKC